MAWFQQLFSGQETSIQSTGFELKTDGVHISRATLCFGMNNQQISAQPKLKVKLKPMMDAIYLIALLAVGSGMSDAIIKGSGL